MELISLLLEGVVEAVFRPERPPWKPYSFHAFVYVMAVISFFASIPVFLVGLLGLAFLASDSADVRQLPPVLAHLFLPFFNIAFCFWLRKRIENRRVVAGALGLVVTANLPFWLVYATHLEDDTKNILIGFAAVYFLVCIFLFAWLTRLNRPSSEAPPVIHTESGRRIVRITPKSPCVRHYPDDPEFLDSLDQVNRKT